jgi:hypothetical protein
VTGRDGAWSTSPTIRGSTRPSSRSSAGLPPCADVKVGAVERHFRNRIALSIIPSGNPREHRKARRMPARANFSRGALFDGRGRQASATRNVQDMSCR